MFFSSAPAGQREKTLKARPRESIHEIRGAARESEGTAVPPISILFPLPKEEEKIRPFSLRFFIRSPMALPKMACHFRQSHLSSTFLSEGEERRKEIGKKISKRGQKSEGKARFYSLCPAGAEEKNTRVRGKPVLFLKEKGPSSAVENRKRFSTADVGSPENSWNFRGTAE